MVNYQDGKIYKLICNTTGLVYIGSTCEPQLARRLAGHVGKYKMYKNGKNHYVTSFKVLEGGDYDIVLIKHVKCNSKEELHAEERKVIESMKCVNKVHPTRTDKQYYEDNLERIQEYKKNYRENNGDKIKEHKKQYYELNKAELSEKTDCQCGGRYDQTHKSRHIKSIKHQNFLNKIQ